jgi:hypothetical protein
VFQNAQGAPVTDAMWRDPITPQIRNQPQHSAVLTYTRTTHSPIYQRMAHDAPLHIAVFFQTDCSSGHRMSANVVSVMAWFYKQAR